MYLRKNLLNSALVSGQSRRAFLLKHAQEVRLLTTSLVSCFLRVLKLFRFNSFKQTFPVLCRWVFSCIKSGLKWSRNIFNLSPIFPITVLKLINRRKLCLSISKITRYRKKQSFWYTKARLSRCCHKRLNLQVSLDVFLMPGKQDKPDRKITANNDIFHR
jgi:hypothetical protein